MSRYKRVFIKALLLSIVTIIYTEIILKGDKIEYSLYVRLLKDYTYSFLFSTILFSEVKNDLSYVFYMNHYKTHGEFRKNFLMSKIIIYGILLGIYSFFQIIYYIIRDPYFNIITLFYRNFVFYILILFVCYIVYIFKCTFQNKSIFIIYLLWLLGLFIILFFPEVELIKMFDVFSLIIKIDYKLICYYLLILLSIVLIIEINARKDNFLRKWLEE